MKLLLMSATAICFCIPAARAQEVEFSKPEAAQVWLQQFAGEWKSKTKSEPIGDHPATEKAGKMSSKMLGGFWIINRMAAVAGGFKFQAIQTIGYDPAKKKYVGTWIDSMMNYMWHYEGAVDSSGRKLELIAEGPNMIGGKGLATYRDSYEFKSADHIIARSEVKDENGEWKTFMTGNLSRIKE